MIRVLVILLLLAPTLSQAYTTTDSLYKACNTKQEDINQAMQKTHCYGYIQGIVEGLQLSFGVNPETKFICFPEKGMSGDQQQEIVAKYIEAHPEELQISARSTILVAFQHAYGCK